MIVVKVLLWPGGNEDQEQLLATGQIINNAKGAAWRRLTGTGRYDAVFFTEDGQIFRKTDFTHNRSDNVWVLIRRALYNMIKEKE